MPRTCPALAAALILMAGATGTVIGAESPPSGRAIAEQWCSGCHAIERAETHSPLPQAPSFWALARDPSINERSIRLLLRTPHASMPNIRFTPDELDEISGYIASLGQQ